MNSYTFSSHCKDLLYFRDLDHPNILKLLGQCTETSPFLAILEYPALVSTKLSASCFQLSTSRSVCERFFLCQIARNCCQATVEAYLYSCLLVCYMENKTILWNQEHKKTKGWKQQSELTLKHYMHVSNIPWRLIETFY